MWRRRSGGGAAAIEMTGSCQQARLQLSGAARVGARSSARHAAPSRAAVGRRRWRGNWRVFGQGAISASRSERMSGRGWGVGGKCCCRPSQAHRHLPRPGSLAQMLRPGWHGEPRSLSSLMLPHSRCSTLVANRDKNETTCCLTACQELSRQRVGLASPDNSDTHDSNGGRGRRGRCGSGGGATSYTSAASVEDREPAELQAT